MDSGEPRDADSDLKCTLCNNFAGHSKSPFGFHRTSSMSELRSSAAACEYCLILLRGARTLFKAHGKDEAVYTSFSIVLGNEYREMSGVFEGLGERLGMDFFASEERDVPVSWRCVPESKRTVKWSGSADALAVITGWIAKCKREHAGNASGGKDGGLVPCCDSPAVSRLPRRVLDVGVDGSTVRLVETNGLVGEYLCLSHCWGKGSHITTTIATLEDRKRGVPWEELSQTFKDAVKLIRALGKRYLWIDSLCIVQDDLQDWEQQSADMATIYSGGLLTIAATRSEDGTGGLFSHTQDVELSGLTSQREPYHVYLRTPISHGLETQPLLQRAWVFQERLLSTRVLHFGLSELAWECKSDGWCECGLFGSWSDIKLEYAAITDFSTPPINTLAQAKRARRIATLWHRMVEKYSSQGLSKRSDRLPAIRGLAKHLQPAKASRYLAGLWEESLIPDLLWRTCGEENERLCPGFAPSWSWASVSGPASLTFSPWVYPDLDERSISTAKIERCTIESPGIDEFGCITRGAIEITGLLAKGILEHFPHGAPLFCTDQYKRIFSPDFRFKDRESILNIYCFQIAVVLDHGEPMVSYSLVLEEAPGESGAYVRIGLLEENRDHDTGSLQSPFSDTEVRTISII